MPFLAFYEVSRKRQGRDKEATLKEGSEVEATMKTIPYICFQVLFIGISSLAFAVHAVVGNFFVRFIDSRQNLDVLTKY